MKAFNDYGSITVAKATEKLPVGGYVLKIQNVRYENGQNGASDRLVLAFDVAEGEYKDFFKKQYDANTSEDKKWKGTTTLYVPTDDGSENDKWTKQKFKRYMTAIEDSNPGYNWNWDESTLKGKFIGGIFGEVMSTIDTDDGAKDITYVQMRFPASVNDVRKNNFKLPEVYDRRKNKTSNIPTATAGGSDPFIVVENGYIPF